MAEQDRRKSSGKSKPPITSHPLFPAIVALWFGALFGLGSLAIRPGLLESVVLATHIDTLVPAAAPPLGLTSRILLALVLSGIGGLIGASIAHRIAAPRPERRERRRAAGVVAGSAHAASEGRRRPLTADVDYAPRDFDEHAPLPGGSPQILHVSDFDFAEPAPSARNEVPAADDEPEDRRVEAPETVEVRLVGGRSAEDAAVPAPLDLGTFAEQDEDIVPLQVPEAHVSLSRDPQPAATPQRRFDAPQQESSYGFFSRDAEAAAQAALPDRFDAITKSAPPLFGSRATTAGSTAQPVPAPSPAPFAPPAATVTLAMGAAPPPAFQAQPAPVEEAAPAPAPDQPAAVQPEIAPEIAPERAENPAPVNQPAAFAPPAGVAAERIATAELAQLSPVELIERLALSLQARRERAVAPRADTPAQAVEPTVAPVEQQPAAAPVAAAIADAPPAATSAEPAAPAIGRLTPIAISLEGTGIVPPPVRLPAALRPIGIDLGEEDGDNLPSYLPPRHIGFAQKADTEDADAAAIAPATQPAEAPVPFAAPFAAPFAMPATAQAQEPASEPDLAPFSPAMDAEGPAIARLPRFETPAEDTEDTEAAETGEALAEDDSQVLEDGYSSLLDLTRRPQPRQPFVRIEEPEPEAAAIEPVVVFPGQAANPVASPVSVPRPFDAPSTAPAAAASRVAAAPQQSREETERALRSALASLQRMSGAA